MSKIIWTIIIWGRFIKVVITNGYKNIYLYNNIIYQAEYKHVFFL